MTVQGTGRTPSIDAYLPRIEAKLDEIVRTAQDGQSEYYGMMRYHLGWVDELQRPGPGSTGKRLRPLLCLLCCEAAGGNPWRALPAAAAVELVHSFSLVHDDIQDRSRMRRGRRAVWDVWGAAHGINVGDGLFVLARMAMYRLTDHGVAAACQQAAMRALDEACLALCEGQYLDMSFEARSEVSLPEYLVMIGKKTAALMAASAQLGAIVAMDQTVPIGSFYSFGMELGMAFQIQDDVLGIWGDRRVTGKSAAADIRDRKKTLPILYALQDAEPHPHAEELKTLYSGPAPLDPPAIERVLAILERVGAREYAEGAARQYTHRALEHLASFGLENAAGSRLYELATSLLGREA